MKAEIKDKVEAHVKRRVQEFKDSGLGDADIMVAAMGSALEIIPVFRCESILILSRILYEVQNLKISID